MFGIGDNTEEQFSEYFKQYGELEDYVVLQDGASGKPKGFGFVVFKRTDSAYQCLNVQNHKMNGKDILLRHTS